MLLVEWRVSVLPVVGRVVADEKVCCFLDETQFAIGDEQQIYYSLAGRRKEAPRVPRSAQFRACSRDHSASISLYSNFGTTNFGQLHDHHRGRAYPGQRRDCWPPFAHLGGSNLVAFPPEAAPARGEVALPGGSNEKLPRKQQTHVGGGGGDEVASSWCWWRVSLNLLE